MKFYAYLWLRKDGTPYYAGKGTGKRAFCSLIGHRPPKDRSRIVVMYCRNEEEAFQTEVELIRNWGRKDIDTGCLRNRTDGGDGSSGYRPTKATRLKQSLAMKGHRNSLSTRTKMSAAKKGVHLSEEHKEKLSVAHKNMTFSEKHRNSLSRAMRGNKNGQGHEVSVEARLALAASMQGNTRTKGKHWRRKSRPEEVKSQ